MLPDVINWIHLTDIYRTFHKPQKSILLSQQLMGLSPKRHKFSPKHKSKHRYKKMEITLYILSDNHELGLDIKNNRKFTK